MQTIPTITISQIAETGVDDALAAIEELESFGYVTATDDTPLKVTDDYGVPITTGQAIAAIRGHIA